MTLGRRLERLEANAGFGMAPAACLVYADGVATVHLATGEQLPRDEFRRRWPNAPTMKAYGDPRMVDPLAADWSDAPAPRSSAEV